MAAKIHDITVTSYAAERWPPTVDGTVDVPEALKPYLNAELIGKHGLS
jgi:hypothetical protein